VNYLPLNLKTLKTAFGYTDEDLLRLLNVTSLPMLRNYLAGTYGPSKKRIEEFAAFVGITCNDLIEREISWEEAKALSTQVKQHPTSDQAELIAALRK